MKIFSFIYHHKAYKSEGFTLIETLIAVFILALTVSSLVSLTSGGYFSIRYVRNQIVATSLIGETLEYVRNTKDTALQNGILWQDWQNEYLLANLAPTARGCFDPKGCSIDPYTSQSVKTTPCTTTCPLIVYFPEKSIYAYSTTFTGFTTTPTTFRRKVTARTMTDPNQIEVTVEVSWLNGTLSRTLRQSVLMTNWTP